LHFQNIPVRAVLQVLADFTHINMVIADDVEGKITLRLHEIPWDQALDIILRTQGLDKRHTGNVMSIDKASNLASREIHQLKTERSLKKQLPMDSYLIQINYAKATDIAAMLKDKENSLLSKHAHLSVDVRTNSIWLQDKSTQIETIKKLVMELDRPVKQVLIESRIVTVDKEFEQDLGVRFGLAKPKHLSGTLVGADKMQQISKGAMIPLAERLNLDLAARPTGMNPASVAIALAKLGDGILLDLELSAMESEGRGEIIASPRLITSNQQAAVIESGTEIPYQESTSSGATAIAFKKAVLSLSVTPQITPNNKIMMSLKISQDEPGKITGGVPAINTKQIQTNVLVNNGQTIVLGGINKQSKTHSVDKVPILGNLPFLGRLFRRDSEWITNEELLIFITPRIMSNIVVH
jgi:type IV pilus assembly protein PilQ